jgi:F-type H+-transporting ATPase subunit delta
MAGDLTTIARPYAEAAYERAKELGQVQAWSDALGLLSQISSDPQAARQIANPNVPRGRVRDLLLEIAGEALPHEVANLVGVLTDNARLAAIPEIAHLFTSAGKRIRGFAKWWCAVRSRWVILSSKSSPRQWCVDWAARWS